MRYSDSPIYESSAIELTGQSLQSPTQQAYDELVRAYQHFNTELFEGKLGQCLLTFSRSKKYAGYYAPARFVNSKLQKADEISLNPALFAVNAVEDVLSTLVHEMVHKQQYDFFRPSRRGYHNREWADLMLKVGLCPSHNGEPGGQQTGERMTHYIVAGGAYETSVAKLLQNNFGIVWFDRQVRAVVRKPKPMPVQPDVSEPAIQPTETEMDGEPGGSGLAGKETNPSEPSDDDPSTGHGKPAETEGDHPPKAEPKAAPCELAELDLQVDPPAQKNRSLRVKYRCQTESPKHQVWGKPGLNLFCNECKVNMVCAEDVPHAAPPNEPAPSPSPSEGVPEPLVQTDSESAPAQLQAAPTPASLLEPVDQPGPPW